jgi:hypothetical protein
VNSRVHALADETEKSMNSPSTIQVNHVLVSLPGGFDEQMAPGDAVTIGQLQPMPR